MADYTNGEQGSRAEAPATSSTDGNLGTAHATSEPLGMRGILAHYEAADVGAHPLFMDLASQEPDLRAMWAIVHNFREGISRHLVRWLSGVLHRSDTSLQCILIQMLHDELGGGLPERVHSTLLDRWYHALEPFQLDGNEDELIAPGRALGLRLEGYFANPDVHVGLAAVMVAEVFAEKFDKCLLREMRRTSSLGEHEIEWLTMHCEVEEAHAEAAAEMARLIDADGAASERLRLAAAGTWEAFEDYLHGVRRLWASRAVDHVAA